MKNYLVAGIVLGLATLACSTPVQVNFGQPNPAVTLDVIYVTATSLSQAAPASQTDPTLTQPASVQVASSPVPQLNSTPLSTSTQLPTTNSSVTTVTVSQDTNCRNGPGTQFDITGQLLIGETAEVVGRNTATNYWIITKPGSSATCWLWGKYATVSGDTSKFIEYALPATPTLTPTVIPAPPAAVSNLQLQQISTCTAEILPNMAEIKGTITWQDNADNEQGFYIYTNQHSIGIAIDPSASLPANTTSYDFSVYTLYNGLSLIVESYNAAGSSERVEVEIPYSCHP